MRPHWYPGNGNAELEALQTDVMRFIAIIGLCLAAIFSLVNGAAQESDSSPSSTAVGVSATAPEVSETRALEPRAPDLPPESGTQKTTAPVKADPPEVPEPVPEESAPPEPAAGFTLEFASEAVLQSLISEGRVTLYVKSDGQFWMHRREGGFAPSDSPASYYQMQAETVPRRLRSLAEGLGLSTGVEWGVTLPTATRRQIDAFMTDASGGDLLIQAGGEVVLR